MLHRTSSLVMSPGSRSSLEETLMGVDGGDVDFEDLHTLEQSHQSSFRRIRHPAYYLPSTRRLRLCGIVGPVVLVCLFIGLFILNQDIDLLERWSPKIQRPQPAAVRYTKPRDARVIGIVFYGRRHRVSVLECYLKRNLVSAGGWLDEVIWIANTDIIEDLLYLEELLLTSDRYRKLSVVDRHGHGYVEAWKAALKPENIYVKLDDDVVFLGEDAIPLMVQLKIGRPDSLFISANMINSPEFNWLHYRAGALFPYLPEIIPTATELSTSENGLWRASKLPQWYGSSDWTSPDAGNDDFNEIWATSRKHEGGNAAEQDSKEGKEEGEIVVPRHRWLPLPNTTDLSRTPIAQAEYDPSGKGWYTWALPAQQHYSFLQNLEDQTTNKYFLTHGFGQGSDATWDTTGHRISINCMVITGKDMLDNIDGMGEDDEQYLSVDLPLKLNRRVLVHTQALASHYRFQAQAGVDKTDIFSRYRGYAAEMVCPRRLISPAGSVDILGNV